MFIPPPAQTLSLPPPIGLPQWLLRGNSAPGSLLLAEQKNSAPSSLVELLDDVEQKNSAPTSLVELLDLKLHKLRASLQVRLIDVSCKDADIIRQLQPLVLHLSQLRYYIDVAPTHQ